MPIRSLIMNATFEILLALAVLVGVAAPVWWLGLVLARRQSDCGTVGYRRVVGAIVLLVLLLVALTFAQSSKQALVLDDWLNIALSWSHERAIVHLARWVTRLGDSAALAAVMVVASGFLLMARRYRDTFALWFAFVGMQVSVWALKFWIDRPRPKLFPSLDTVLSPSYPSAHAAGSLTVYVFVALLIVTPSLIGTIRYHAAFGAVLVTGLIALSRLVYPFTR